MGFAPSIKFARASRRPKESLKELSQGLSKKRQQVAAVCYRIGKSGAEFLLVQTRGGRWIFPKGGVEPGLTQAQSAAIEAIEEAGVHGRMEEIPFARYVRKHESASVAAHLCEVARLEAPQESGRSPTWLSAEKAKQHLQKDRAQEFGAELARVIDRGLSRIQRLHARGRNPANRVYREGLREVRFEAFEYARLPGGHSGDLREAVIARYLYSRDARSSAAMQVEVPAHLRRIPQIAARGEIRRPILRLGTGVGSPADTANNITAIDGGRRAVPSPGNQPSCKSRRPKT
jgi:8-oxo-dGTP pyrophosphatase MutT (NUDIX family)